MRSWTLALSSCLVVVACSSSDDGGSGTPNQGTTAGPIVSIGKVQKGIATYYDADGTGNCSFDAPSSGELLVVAPNKARHFAASAICGGCLRVTGAKGSVVVRVTDSCPTDTPENDCGDTGADLDLSAQAFAKIDDPDKGKINVTFELVACNVSGSMSYHFKEGSSEYWTAVQVLNHRVPVAKVEYKSAAGAWTEMARADYNYFIEDHGVGKTPGGLTLRITSATGQQVEEVLKGGVEDNKTVDGKKQFD